MKFADPTNDIAFKKIFGDENKTEILISFLNAVLGFENRDKIEEITILNSYQHPDIMELKNTILDIKAQDGNHNRFIVEMQVDKDVSVAKRSLYYTSKSYVAQIKKAENYKKLKKVYFIGILNFSIFDNSNYISRHLILDNETLKQEIKDFEFTFVELPKFDKKLKELETVIEKWIFFIKNASNFEMIPQELGSIEEFKEAFETARYYQWTENEMEVYDYLQIREGRRISELDTAREDGEMKGKIEGKIEGKMEGKIEEKIATAKIALNQGLDIDMIILLTGLSIEEIKKL